MLEDEASWGLCGSRASLLSGTEPPARDSPSSPNLSPNLSEQGTARSHVDSALDGALSPWQHAQQQPWTGSTQRSSPAEGEGDAAHTEEVAAARRAKQARQAARSVVDVPLRPRSHYLNLLVVGEPGMGKSTLIENLFHPFAIPAAAPAGSTAGNGCPRTCSSGKGLGSGEQGKGNEAHACEVGNLRVQARRFQAASAGSSDTFHYTVLEVGGPGAGAGADQASALQAFVAGAHEEYAARVCDHGRRCIPWELPDCRLDACLLLVPPHHLPSSLAAAASGLAAALPVLPVLAKADCMTAAELLSHRQATRRSLGLVGPVLYPPEPSLLLGVGMAKGAEGYPLAVIGSSEVDSSVDGYWPVRRYAWGAVECFNEAQSDVLAVRHLLLESGFQSIKDATESRHRDHLTTALLSRTSAGHAIPALGHGQNGLTAQQQQHAAQRGGSAAHSGSTKHDGSAQHSGSMQHGSSAQHDSRFPQASIYTLLGLLPGAERVAGRGERPLSASGGDARGKAELECALGREGQSAIDAPAGKCAWPVARKAAPPAASSKGHEGPAHPGVSSAASPPPSTHLGLQLPPAGAHTSSSEPWQKPSSLSQRAQRGEAAAAAATAGPIPLPTAPHGMQQHNYHPASTPDAPFAASHPSPPPTPTPSHSSAPGDSWDPFPSPPSRHYLPTLATGPGLSPAALHHTLPALAAPSRCDALDPLDALESSAKQAQHSSRPGRDRAGTLGSMPALPGAWGYTVRVELVDESSLGGPPSEELVLRLVPEQTIGELKQKIWRARGIPPEFQDLRDASGGPQDDTPLADAALLCDRLRPGRGLSGSGSGSGPGQGQQLHAWLRLRVARVQLFVKGACAAVGEGSGLSVVSAWPWQSVGDVKQLVQDLQGTPVELQRLSFIGRQLSDDATLARSGVKNNNTLHLSLRQPGEP